jgi:hypothetical protein
VERSTTEHAIVVPLKITAMPFPGGTGCARTNAPAKKISGLVALVELAER